MVVDGEGNEVGKVTSGGFSPSLEAPIAMAYVPLAYAVAGHAGLAGVARQDLHRDRHADAVRSASLSPQGSAPMSVYYTKEHEWVRVEGDSATVGITDFAQGQLGDVVFVEVPEAGRSVAKGGEAAVVESVKAASDVYAPVGGTVTEGNQALVDEPSLVNTDPEGEGWFFKLTLSDNHELGELMNAEQYKSLLREPVRTTHRW